MNCKEAIELAEEAMDRDLPRAVKRRLDLHLSRCESCRQLFKAEHDEHVRWFRIFNDPAAMRSLPPGFADRLAATARVPRPDFWFRIPRWVKIAASLMALASFASFAAVVAGRLSSTSETSPGSDDAAMAQKGSQATDGTEATAVSSADTSSVSSVPVVPSDSSSPSTPSSNNQLENRQGETEMKQINSTMKAAALALAVTGASAANGSIIAWYRFNEGTFGSKVGSSVTIENSANPGVLTGKCQIRKSEAVMEDSTDGDYLPIATNAFPSGVGILEGGSGVKYANEHSLYFRNACATWSYNTDTGNGSCVTVPRSAALAPSSFTVECFFKSIVGSGTTQGSLQFLAVLPGSWRLAVQSDGKLWGEVTTTAGTAKSLSSPNNTSGRDKKWHHAAITFDASEKMFRLYFDYTLAYSVSADDVAYNSALTTPMSIGCTSAASWNGRFNGFIDEVRISDVALQPNNFLRCAAYDAEINAPATACHVSFENVGPIYFGSFWANLNCVTGANAPSAYIDRNAAAQEAATDSTTIPAPLLFGATADSVATIANATSIHFATNGTGLSSSLFIDDRNNGAHTVLDGSFTAELFIRAVEPPNQIVSHRKPYVLCYGNRAFYIELAKDNGGTILFGVDDTAFASQTGICDGNWHHVAFVYDRDAHIVKAYVDYVRIGKAANSNINLGNIDAYYSLIQVGGGYGLAADAHDIKFNGWIDEVRLSNCALPKSEFLSSILLKRGTKIIFR